MDDTGRLRAESTNTHGDTHASGRALFVFPGALGDLLLLAPAVATLRARGVIVELSVNRVLGALARSVLGCVLGPDADGRAMSSLFGERLVAELEGWWRGASRVHVWFGSAASQSVATHARALGIPSAFTHSIERADGPRHASAGYAAVLGIDPPLIVPRRDAAAAAPTSWTVPFARRLVIHPGAGDPRKRWDRRGFITVADAWRRRGGEVVVLLGPAEEHEAAAWRQAGLPVMAGLELIDAATLLASARAFLGNDSGVSHLAGWAGCDGVVLFGPTRPERWRPLGGALVAVEYAGRAYGDVSDVVMVTLLAAAP